MEQNLIKYEIKDIPNTSYLEKLRIKKQRSKLQSKTNN